MTEELELPTFDQLVAIRKRAAAPQIHACEAYGDRAVLLAYADTLRVENEALKKRLEKTTRYLHNADEHAFPLATCPMRTCDQARALFAQAPAEPEGGQG